MTNLHEKFPIYIDYFKISLAKVITDMFKILISALIMECVIKG